MHKPTAHPSQSTTHHPHHPTCSGNRWLLDKKGFQAKLRPELVYSWRQVLKVAEEGKPKEQGGPVVVDARGAPRFNAEVDEPRPGLARGRIPGSFNVPFDKLLVEGDWTRFRSPDEIKAAYKVNCVTM
jgi:3-mercaptopyruvate sulfurtransferase SseA